MTLVFDAEPLLAFAFDEPGAHTVERHLNQVYDGDREGYVATLNLAEVRYIATRKASAAQADAHIDDLRDMGLTVYSIDDLWKPVSDLKVTYNPAIGDAYAVATAKHLDADTEQPVTVLVDRDDDYEVFEAEDGFAHLIERFRNGAV